jgi:hypothetical protein
MVENPLPAQRLFWGRPLCGAKSKELDLVPLAEGLGTQTVFDFYPPKILAD